MKIKFFSYNIIKLNLIANQLINLLNKFKVKSTLVYLPTKINKVCVPSSMFIYKNSKKHFERRVHSRLIMIKNFFKIPSKIISNFKVFNDVDIIVYL
jgi:ribosomal protein S10